MGCKCGQASKRMKEAIKQAEIDKTLRAEDIRKREMETQDRIVNSLKGILGALEGKVGLVC